MEQNLNSPDKFGLIVQCRQSMDQLPLDELKSFTVKSLDRFSVEQLKTFLFAGLKGVKERMKHAQVSDINASMNESVRKFKKKISDSSDKKSEKSPPPSLTQVIPHQVLSNVVCPFLMMADISEWAKVSRTMCIIAHIPASISNLCIRHDPFRYSSHACDYDIDGVFGFNVGSRSFRFQNVRKLALCGDLEENFANVSLPNVQELSLHANENGFNGGRVRLPALPSLANITFENFDVYEMLSVLNRYRSESRASEAPFNDTILQLETLALVNCREECVEMNDDAEAAEFAPFSELIVPSQPNRLKVLKFVASTFVPADRNAFFDRWSRQLLDLDKLKTSFANLEGFVYSKKFGDVGDDLDLFYLLSLQVLRNAHLFSRLRSIHVHDPSMIINDLVPANNNIFGGSIEEFCTTLSPETLRDAVVFRGLQEICRVVSKCCFVVEIRATTRTTYLAKICELFTSILQRTKNLKLLQLVLVQNSECAAKDKKIIEFGRLLIDVFRTITSTRCFYSSPYSERKFVFKMHIKSMHQTLRLQCDGQQKSEYRAMVTNIIMNFFLAFPKSIIQLKLSDNCMKYYYQLEKELSSLKALLDVHMNSNHRYNMGHLIEKAAHAGNELNSCYSAHDYRFFAVSASGKRSGDCDLKYDKRWEVDCLFCCNTPWV